MRVLRFIIFLLLVAAALFLAVQGGYVATLPLHGDYLDSPNATYLIFGGGMLAMAAVFAWAAFRVLKPRKPRRF